MIKPLKELKNTFNGLLSINKKSAVVLSKDRLGNYLSLAFGYSNKEKDKEIDIVKITAKNDDFITILKISKNKEFSNKISISILIEGESELKQDLLLKIENDIKQYFKNKDFEINQVFKLSKNKCIFFILIKDTIKLNERIFSFKISQKNRDLKLKDEEVSYLYKEYSDVYNKISPIEKLNFLNCITSRFGVITEESKELLELNYKK